MSLSSPNFEPSSPSRDDRWKSLEEELSGELHRSPGMRRIYATDASAYQELPLAVAIPADEDDLRALIGFATREEVGLIPRTAGTSLAGQVVGNGIVIDLSRHFTRILEINAEEGWVRVEPGVIRNELNQVLQAEGLYFGPETSTQNRAMLGGMLGNNSCGSNSIRYGSVRDHVLEVTALLSDGSTAVFGSLDAEEFDAKCQAPASRESDLYREIRDLLNDPAVRREITREFPKPTIHRRNTGYALDLLMDAACFDSSSREKFHFGKLIAGSEGTLCLATEMKLHCSPLPPPVSGLQCAHFSNLEEALQAVETVLGFPCFACELIDDIILECTERSLEHRENRFFLEGRPAAILVTEIRGHSQEEVAGTLAQLESDLRQAGLGYAFPALFGSDTVRIWNLRKAGLGLMSTLPGDAKPVPVVEDTAVDVSDLPSFIAEFDRLLDEKFQLRCVHYAHAGSGELHLRPIINLKTESGNRLFREVASSVANLVKKYRGSLSGEHGDGRLRAEFLRSMVGENNYRHFVAIKNTWDPDHIFNPGKIVDAPPMDQHLRYRPGQETPGFPTLFDWSSTQGMLRAAEMCNGSADCRKTERSGGTMCPSYMATRREEDTTRARANLLRHALTSPDSEAPLDNEDLKQVLDLCLSCKGCKKECPSSVDMTKMKAEFQQQYYDIHGSPFRTRVIARFSQAHRLASAMPGLWNSVFGNPRLRELFNRAIGFHPERTLPPVAPLRFSHWFQEHEPAPSAGRVGAVYLFRDEFTEFLDVNVGIQAVELLERLGYRVEIPDHLESGRTWLSKGFVRRAKEILNQNLRLLAPLIREDQPLIGIEPSALLTFRDEALDLAEPSQREAAARMAAHCFTLEEFLARELDQGRVSSHSFTDRPAEVHLHGHCFQKALSSTLPTVAALSLPRNYRVTTIPSGCCGMAGSFGYEREHFDLSMAIGNLVLFPAVVALPEEAFVAAPGTSCRHQILDGTGRRALHPVEILRQALTSS